MSECVFCTDKLFKVGEVPAALCCGHVFHASCVRTWFRTKKQCPICKQTQATCKVKDGIIQLFMDVSGPSPIKLASTAEDGRVDLTGDDTATAASDTDTAGEVHLLRHNLLHTQRALDDKERQIFAITLACNGMQESLRAQSDKCESLQAQLRDLKAALQASDKSLTSRDHEILTLKHRIASEEDEVRKARSVQAQSDAQKLEEKGYHNEAIDRLMEHCSGQELFVQLKRMFKCRHDRFAKLEDKSKEMHREILALKNAESLQRRKEQQLVSENKILRQKLHKARESAGAHQQVAPATPSSARGDELASSTAEHDSDLTLSTRSATGSPTSAGDGRGNRTITAQAGTRAGFHTPQTVAKGGGETDGAACHVSASAASWSRLGGSAEAGSHLPMVPTKLVGHELPLAKAKSRMRSCGSLVRQPTNAASAPWFMSNDPDDGGRFIRSGPDGMGGTINVLIRDDLSVARNNGTKPKSERSHFGGASNSAGAGAKRASGWPQSVLHNGSRLHGASKDQPNKRPRTGPGSTSLAAGAITKWFSASMKAP